MTYMGTHIYITSILLFFLVLTVLQILLAGRLAQNLPVWHTNFEQLNSTTEFRTTQLQMTKLRITTLRTTQLIMAELREGLNFENDMILNYKYQYKRYNFYIPPPPHGAHATTLSVRRMPSKPTCMMKVLQITVDVEYGKSLFQKMRVHTSTKLLSFRIL
jgi:hypothetical protein